MKLIYAFLLAFALPANGALATGDVYCHAVDGSDAEFGYGFGRVSGLAIVSATIRAAGRHYSLIEAEGAVPSIMAQGAYDGPRTIIDFTDPQFSEIVASVRIISAVEGDAYRAVGTLRIPDVGVYALMCE